MQKIKKNDNVILIAGKSKGQVGAVLAVDPQGDRIKIQGTNLATKAVKANPQKNITGGFRKVEMFIDISNVAIYNPNTKKKDKVVIETLADGKRVRKYRSTGEIIDA
jgi:large subunit ribosomal protein L24